MATAAQLYDALRSDRDWYLDRGRQAGRLTLPYLVPDSNDGEVSKQSHALPWNGIGARGVLNLASRIMLAILPPTQAFFRFALNEVEMARQGIDPATKTEYEQALSRMEREVLRSIEATNDRTALHEALLWLIVTGNVLLYVGQEGLKVYHLNRYVCQRDPMGNPLEAITCEQLPYSALPQKVKDLLEEDELTGILPPQDEPLKEYEKTVKIYTHVQWDKKKVRWHQEVKGLVIPGSQGTAPITSNPWMPLRMSRVDGQPYGVGYVESAALADLQTAEALSQAVAEGSLACAAVRFLVKPSGVTKAKALAEAANGAFVPGDVNDVAPLQVLKAQDMGVAMQGLARIEARLSQAFMLADVRDSERTTAEEVRLQAIQIENSLGAIYSILSQEFQQPYVSRKLDLLVRDGRMPALPPELVRPVVSVGLAAVGRNNDMEKIVQFVQTIGATVPDAIPQFIQPGEVIRRLASSLGIDTLNLVKTDEQIAQEQQQAQEQMLMQQAMQSPMNDPAKVAQAQAMAMEAEQPPTTEEPV
jgi:hypothetical protein